MEFFEIESILKECFQSANNVPVNLSTFCQNHLIKAGKNTSYVGPSFWQDSQPAIVYHAEKQQYLFSLPLCEKENAQLYWRNLIQIMWLILADVNGQLIMSFKTGTIDKELLLELNKCTESLIQFLSV